MKSELGSFAYRSVQMIAFRKVGGYSLLLIDYL